MEYDAAKRCMTYRVPRGWHANGTKKDSWYQLEVAVSWAFPVKRRMQGMTLKTLRQSPNKVFIRTELTKAKGNIIMLTCFYSTYVVLIQVCFILLSLVNYGPYDLSNISGKP